MVQRSISKHQRSKVKPYIKRFGTEYGGFYYPADLPGLDENSTVCCVGAGEDITHDLMVAHTLKSNVYIFDPTPRAKQHVEMVKDYLACKEVPNFINKSGHREVGGGIGWKNYWEEISKCDVSSESVIFLPVALSTSVSREKFYNPDNSEHVSHSLDSNMRKEGSHYIEVDTVDFTELLNKIDKTKIDFLKLDIEGIERSVIDSMFSANMYPKYLSIDFDKARVFAKQGNYEKINSFLELLHLNGYACIHFDNSSFDGSFIRNANM